MNLIRKNLIPIVIGLFALASPIIAGEKVVASEGKGILHSETVKISSNGA